MEKQPSPAGPIRETTRFASMFRSHETRASTLMASPWPARPPSWFRRSPQVWQARPHDSVVEWGQSVLFGCCSLFSALFFFVNPSQHPAQVWYLCFSQVCYIHLITAVFLGSYVLLWFGYCSGFFVKLQSHKVLNSLELKQQIASLSPVWLKSPLTICLATDKQPLSAALFLSIYHFYWAH